MKILHVMGWRSEGYGVARYAAELARAQARLGHATHMLTTARPSGEPDRVDDGVHWHALQGEYPFFAYNDSLQAVLTSLPLTDRLRELWERDGPFDVICSHGWEGAVSAGIGQRVFDCPYVATLHGTQVGRMGGKGTREDIYVADMEKWACDRAERVIVPSRFVRREIQERYGVPAGKANVVPGGIGPETFEARVDVEDFREMFAAPTESLVFFAGRLAPEKGPDLLIRAVSRALQSSPGARARFVLAGDGPMKGSLHGEIEKRGMAGRVRLAGPLGPTVMGALYRVADLMVVPSRYEAFGIGALEAVAWGIPVLSSSSGGLPELAEKVGAAAIQPINPENSSQFASAIVDSLKTLPKELPPRTFGGGRVPRELTWREVALRSIEVFQQAERERTNIAV